MGMDPMSLGIMGAASLAGQGLQMAQSGKSGKASVPPQIRGPLNSSLGIAEERLYHPPTPYMYPRVAPMSPFQNAALGQMANLALVQGAQKPTSGTAAFGGATLDQMMQPPKK